MPTITVTQVNISATVLGVTNVNAYLNQINCLASVSEEIQTTIAIPQQTYITATCGSLFANIQITPVQALRRLVWCSFWKCSGNVTDNERNRFGSFTYSFWYISGQRDGFYWSRFFKSSSNASDNPRDGFC